MKKILLLTDFSDASNNAIDFALQFFKKDQSKFYVMHVLKMSSYVSDNLMHSGATDNIYSAIVKDQSNALETLIEEFENRNNNKHSFETIVDYDDFIDAINQTVKQKEIDMVVIGSNGKTGAQEIIFGSNTLNVIRRVKCTTFIIPENYTYNSNKKAVLPLDSTDSLHGNAITELHKFISTYNYKLSVLRITTHNEHPEYAFYDQSNLDRVPHNYFVIHDVPTQHATNSFIQIKDIGLSAIIAHKEKFFHRFLKGSSTTKLNSVLRIPILVLHND